MKIGLSLFLCLGIAQSSSCMFVRAAKAVTPFVAVSAAGCAATYVRDEIMNQTKSHSYTQYACADGDVSDKDAYDALSRYADQAKMYNAHDFMATQAVRDDAREYAFLDEKYTDVCTPLYRALVQIVYTAVHYKRDCTVDEQAVIQTALCAGGYAADQAHTLCSAIRVAARSQKYFACYESTIDRVYLREDVMRELSAGNQKALYILYHEIQHYLYSTGHELRAGFSKDSWFEEVRAELGAMRCLSRAHGTSAVRSVSVLTDINKGYVSGSAHIRNIVADYLEKRA